MNKKLATMRARLVEAQQKLITQAVDAGGLPTDGALRKISDLENAIMAVEHMMEDTGHAKG
ncbi:hypothetical protein [Kaistia terrae]|jgi:hypothetical protein|uniref:Uncharacterized protein n=1 Tax=Kaistia terrae TaxID=537017 RepID=A0ABW0PR84_9HYPH|nr:hypothetical protein [Kaistia terrae]MCX5577906.1 hypothetical protein [Kaistia terrae]